MADSDTEVLEPPVDEDLPAQLSRAAPRRWFNRATPVLLGVFLLAGGFLGGVGAQKQWGAASTGASTSTRGVSGQTPGGMGSSGGPGGGFGNGSGSPGGGSAGGGSAGGGSATVGTITSISAGALIMTTAAGKTITVKIAESGTVLQATTLAKLKAGQSLSVLGSTATDGSITATSVTAS